MNTGLSTTARAMFFTHAISTKPALCLASPFDKRGTRLDRTSVESHMAFSAYWPVVVPSSSSVILSGLGGYTRAAAAIAASKASAASSDSASRSRRICETRRDNRGISGKAVSEKKKTKRTTHHSHRPSPNRASARLSLYLSIYICIYSIYLSIYVYIFK